MYRDPKMIRDREVKVRLNEAELAIFESVVNYTGGQLAPLVRSYALEGALRVLSGQSDLVAEQGEGPKEGPEARRCA